MSNKSKKAVILGAGNVGASIAYTLTVEGVVGEIVLIDINKEKAKGEAMDIIQGTAFCPPVNIYAGDYEDAAGADVVIVTMGMPRKPGQSRIDLAQVNVGIAKDVMSKLIPYAPDAVYLVVSNPVDIMTYTIIKTSGLPAGKVLGTGTMLDTARLRSMLAEHIDLNPKNVHAYVLGEHGDSSFVPWSTASVGGMDLGEYVKHVPAIGALTDELKLSLENDVRTAGARVIACKGATYYAIALSVKRIVECIIRDTRTVMTVSGMLAGEYGIDGVALSIPYIVGSQGILHSVPPPLTPVEVDRLKNSADVLKGIIQSLNI